MFGKKLFGTNVPASCEYCRFSAENDTGRLICRRGNPTDKACRKYIYDPLKREPRAMPQMPQFSPEDFKL